jgi:hypothetical protein
MPSSTPEDAIRNVLATYCIALDSKNWSLLDHVFTSDVDGIYPFAKMKGAKTIATAVKNRSIVPCSDLSLHKTSIYS